MQLNSVMFYKTKLTIACAAAEDLLWKVILHIRYWQLGKWNREREELPEQLHAWSWLKTGGTICSAGRNVFIESEHWKDEQTPEIWACRITETMPPVDGYADRQWFTEIGYEGKENGEAEFSCVVFYCDRAGFIGPYQDAPSPSVPKLIRALITDPTLCVSSGMDILPKDAQKLSVGAWPSFYRKLNDPHRELPYIYISPRPKADGSSGSELLLDPDRLACLVYGNALVYYAEDLEFTREMSCITPDYACYNGAIRVYRPHVTEACQHHYMSAASMERFGTERVLQSLHRAFSANINFYDSFFTLEECRRRKQLAQLRQEHNQEVAGTYELAVAEEAGRLEAEQGRQEAERRLKAMEEDNFALRSTLSALRPAALEAASLREAARLREKLPSLPETAEEVVRYFQSAFADRLAFTPSCERSLKQCILSPEQLWETLYALATTMWELAFCGEGDIYAQFHTRTGIECARCEGRNTHRDKRMMRQFRTMLGEEEIDIEPHITMGKLGQSIHFGFSQRLRRVVIGHCGEHMEIYSTQKHR